MIKIINTHIGYSTPLLHIVDLTLTSGFVYVLIGKNGIGKSTFLRSINGEIKPIKGEIILDGKQAHSHSITSRAKTLSFTAAGFQGIPYLTTREYVTLGRTPHTGILGTLSNEDEVCIQSALETTGIAHLAERFTDQLSDGERQLATIARALTQQTPVILFDEPTAFLDYANKRALMLTLIRIAREEQKCIVLSSHDIDICLEVGAHIMIVDQSQKRIVFAEENASKASLIQQAFGIEL